MSLLELLGSLTNKTVARGCSELGVLHSFIKTIEVLASLVEVHVCSQVSRDACKAKMCDYSHVEKVRNSPIARARGNGIRAR